MRLKKLVVFDMDGVIIDVSGSYRDTVRQTARLFFKDARAWGDLPDPLFSLEELASVKQGGGLNNDWDLTCAVIALLFKRVDAAGLSGASEHWTRYRDTMAGCEVSRLAEWLRVTKKPLSILMSDPDRQDNPLVRAFYRNDVGSGNIIKQIFQEIYLGKDLFRATYGMSPQVYHGDGYIDREKLLMGSDFFKTLSESCKLAIATGRPRSEAEYPLNHFNLRHYFTYLYTLDECIEEEDKRFRTFRKKVSLSKPHPYMLEAIAAKAGNTRGLFYIGDMPDDMVAAARSKPMFTGIGVLSTAPDKEALREKLLNAGARHVIQNLEELPALLSRESPAG
jgi:phosphoglycolate phosphatase-like HAD superfamily hydrolase